MESHSLGAFDAAAILVSLAAALGYLNHRFLRLPASVGLTVMGALASLVVVGVDLVFPSADLSRRVSDFVAAIDFRQTLLEGMLSFLLFAGALHVDWFEMHRGRWPILALSTVSVLLSTFIVGFGLAGASHLLGLNLPLAWCLVFGALISPTDPVAVMAVMRKTSIAPPLQAMVAAESLFNDGVGVVIFSILLASAIGSDTFSASAAFTAFGWEAGGGVLLGLVIGWLGYAAMRTIDEYNVELMITLALVMGGYSLSHQLHVSGPVAMAVAGLLIGNAGVAYAMSEICRDHVLKFWALIDELLNAVLFLLIGLEVIAIAYSGGLILAGLIMIPLGLAARLVSVWVPLKIIRPGFLEGSPALRILTWGGLRGGISVALALSLPPGPERSAILGITYAVVLFSVIVQGGSIGRLLKRLPKPIAPEHC